MWIRAGIKKLFFLLSFKRGWESQPIQKILIRKYDYYNYGFVSFCVCENRIFDILNTYYSSTSIITTMWGVFVGMYDTGYVSWREVALLLELLIWLKQSTPGSFGNVSIKKNQFEMLHLVLGLLFLAENMWRKNKSIFQK